MSQYDQPGGGYDVQDQSTDAGASGTDVHAAPQGVLDRLSNSFGAILFGLVAIPLACWGLFWNEGRAVKTARALAEGQGAVVAIASDRLDPAMNGKLVHVAGNVTSQTGVEDALFGVKAKGLRLHRKVELYQWSEKETGSGQDRKYVYERVWSDRIIDSSKFKVRQGHENQTAMDWPSQTFEATDARIGALPLGPAIASLGGLRDHRIDGSGLATARRQHVWQVHQLDNGYYIGLHPSEPRVGHYRITYQIVPEGPASFVGQQSAEGLAPYKASNGNSFLLAQSGLKKPDEMFEKAQDDNATMTWIIRFVGLFGLFIGFASLFAPVSLLASYIPLLGGLVTGAVKLVALAATAIVGPMVIAFAWFAYRPMVSLVVIGIGAALALGLRLVRQRRQAQPALARAS